MLDLGYSCLGKIKLPKIRMAVFFVHGKSDDVTVDVDPAENHQRYKQKEK